MKSIGQTHFFKIHFLTQALAKGLEGSEVGISNIRKGKYRPATRGSVYEMDGQTKCHRNG